MVLNKNFSVIVIVYGCFARSYRVTKYNHEEKILEVLRKKLRLDFKVIHVDNAVDFIDQESVTPYSHTLQNLSELVQLKQPEVDKQILAKYQDVSSVFNASYYNDSTRLSALRNSYLETQVAQCLKRYSSQSDYAIVFNADLWFEKELNLEWLEQKSVIVGDQNPAGGYTNGFYCGPVNELIQLLNSFDSLSNFQLWDFESIALHRSQKSNIPVLPVSFRFLKIRASGEPAYKTMGFLWPKIRQIAWTYYRSAEIPTVVKIRFFLIEFPADFAKACLAKFKLLVKQVLAKRMLFSCL